MTRKTFLLFLFCITNQAIGQSAFTVDTLMKKKNVKTKTQFECVKNGKNCKVLYQHQYDLDGRLFKHIEFSGIEPFLTVYYHYSTFNKADTIYRQFRGEKKYVSQVYLFDNSGNVIAYQSCFENSGCSLAEKYQYDKNNRLTDKTEFRDGKPDTKTSYIYDIKGNNIKVITQYLTYSSETNELNCYDEKHQKIKSKRYDKDNNSTDSTEYAYDKNGNLNSLNWMGGLGTKSLYTYDTDGNEIEYRSVAFGNQISDHRVMTYKNSLVQSRIHYEGKSVKYFFKFEYEFY